EFPGRDGKSYSLADVCDEADTMISCGNGNIVIHFPAMDRVIGTQEFIEMQIGGWVGCKDEDGGFDAEIQIIIASTIANGFNRLCARGF
ncbi:MAG: glycine/sarcosine/betaine reductase component B subunit, partial [Clostridiales bacterium]|nr:glycine/sarcosine/betaine reductase component B subunit [Clostridiales bacterium]